MREATEHCVAKGVRTSQPKARVFCMTLSSVSPDLQVQFLAFTFVYDAYEEKNNAFRESEASSLTHNAKVSALVEIPHPALRVWETFSRSLWESA